MAPVTAVPAALPFDPWPPGVDWHLTAAACRLAALMDAGCDWRWCPVGGLDVVQADGRMWMIAPVYAARMREAGLLPDVVRLGGLSIPGPPGPVNRMGPHAHITETFAEYGG